MNHNFEEIFRNFSTDSVYLAAKPFGSGNINDTFLVSARACERNCYFFLQRINHFVFSDPEIVMSNTIKVTSHISGMLASEGSCDISRRVLKFSSLAGDSSRFLYRDSQGNYWRLCNFIDSARTYESFDRPSQATNAAIAFGKFQKQMASYSNGQLAEVIPDFLNGQSKYMQLQDIMATDPCARVEQVRSEIDYICANSEIFDILPKLAGAGELPLRITHNDAKVNNVMLDDLTGHGICVIDLDTVMPGFVHYDFGDLVRSVLSSSADIDLKVQNGMPDMELFEAVAQGYLSEACVFLTGSEIGTLGLSARLMSLMLACRFLTDYLAGDVYFKTNFPEHNLIRCRSQIRLYQSLLSCDSHIQDIIARISDMYRMGR